MNRNLVICFDGTSNQYGAINTNVVKLYAMLAPFDPDQLSYYQPGIGTIPPAGTWESSKRRILDAIDLAVAWFLPEHVNAGYRFLMQNYQEGDRVFLFGFSRGSYTARVLAGMLHKVGLLTRGNDELIHFAWNMYKNQKDKGVTEGFKATFCRPVRIHFVGVWDTVSSIGWAWNPGHLPYTANNESVQILRHAMALDERRSKFLQNLWSPTPPAGQDVLQVWFAGDHCDIGGGHPEAESGLSKLALEWMVRQAEASGLKVDPAAKARILPSKNTERYVSPDPLGPLHNSLKGLWWLGEVVPLPVHGPPPEYKKFWALHLAGLRRPLPQACVHHSVRVRKESMGYVPKNLPEDPVWTE